MTCKLQFRSMLSKPATVESAAFLKDPNFRLERTIIYKVANSFWAKPAVKVKGYGGAIHLTC